VIDDADSRGMVMPKLYFDVELPANGAPRRSSQGYRSYSTNKAERRYAPDCYAPYRRQPCDRLHDRYIPEISTIIVPNYSRCVADTCNTAAWTSTAPELPPRNKLE